MGIVTAKNSTATNCRRRKSTYAKPRPVPVRGSLPGAVAQRPRGDRVEERVRREHDESADDQFPPASAENRGQRSADPLAAFERPDEHRGLGQPQPHVQPDRHHDRARQERDPPTPRQEWAFQIRFGVAVAQPEDQADEQSIGQKETERRAQLRPYRSPRPLVGLGGLGGQQRRPAPLAAQGEALTEAHDRQQSRRNDSHLVVGG